MKPLLPLVLVAAAGLLCGCPDAKMPKAPPKIPEPKVALTCPELEPSRIPVAMAKGPCGLPFA